MKLSLLTVLPILINFSSAWAAPSIYPLDLTQLQSLNNPTSSNLIADDLDTKKIYVMPPNVAEAKVSGLHTLSANVGFCGEVSDLQKYSRRATEKIAQLSEQELKYKPQVDQARKALSEAREEAARFATENKLSALFDLDTQIQQKEDRLSALYKSADNCKSVCENIKTEIIETEKAKNQLMKDRRDIAHENTEQSRAYDRKKAIVEARAQNLADAEEGFTKIEERIKSLRSDFHKMYSDYAKMEGGRAALIYDSHWDENVSGLRAANPGFDFEKINTQNAKLFSSLKGVKDIPADLTVLAYEIAGTPKDNYMELNAGFPPKLSSNIVLSLLGVCPMLHPADFDLKAPNSVSEMKYGLTITYDFPTTVNLKASARYNMYKMFEKIVSSGSSGGFFSSHSWTSVEERNFFRDSFSINWTEQDPQNTVTEDQRANVERDMRSHIMERLGSLALPSAPDREAIISAGAPPAHGAVVVASSLMTGCPTNIYCVGASLLFTSLDAIFGSSSSSANYKQIQDIWLDETWSRSQVILKPWVTSYVPSSTTEGSVK